MDRRDASRRRVLDVLERGDLVIRKREGTRRMCHINPTGLRKAHRWLSEYEEFWIGAVDRLGAALEQYDADSLSSKTERD